MQLTYIIVNQDVPLAAVVVMFNKDVEYIHTDRVIRRKGIPAYNKYLVKWKSPIVKSVGMQRESMAIRGEHSKVQAWNYNKGAVSIGGESCNRPPQIPAQTLKILGERA